MTLTVSPLQQPPSESRPASGVCHRTRSHWPPSLRWGPRLTIGRPAAERAERRRLRSRRSGSEAAAAWARDCAERILNIIGPGCGLGTVWPQWCPESRRGHCGSSTVSGRGPAGAGSSTGSESDHMKRVIVVYVDQLRACDICKFSVDSVHIHVIPSLYACHRDRKRDHPVCRYIRARLVGGRLAVTIVEKAKQENK